VPAGARVSVAVAQFEDLVARGLRVLIEEDDQLALVADAVPQERIAEVLATKAPQVALLNFGSLRTPLEVRELAAAHPDTRLIVLANRPTRAQCDQLLAFGATGCLSKESPAREIVSALQLASRGLDVPPRTDADAPSRGPDLLTPREAGVLELLQQGSSNGEIAAQLQIGIETVRTHARSIYRKLGVRSRRDLARLNLRVSSGFTNGT
jgi:DNA-binding NarL/FixJ family response regulator